MAGNHIRLYSGYAKFNFKIFLFSKEPMLIIIGILKFGANFAMHGNLCSKGKKITTLLCGSNFFFPVTISHPYTLHGPDAAPNQYKSFQ